MTLPPPEGPNRPLITPVFLDAGSDRVTGVSVHCGGLVLPIDSIASLQRMTQRRHELGWAVLPVVALIALDWHAGAISLALAVALAWWRLPPVHRVELSLRDGQRVDLLRTTDGARATALSQALAKALVYRWVQSETVRQAHADTGAPPSGAYDPAWRDAAFDEIHDSGSGPLRRSDGAELGGRL